MAKLMTVARGLAGLDATDRKLAITIARDLAGDRKPRRKRAARKSKPRGATVPRVAAPAKMARPRPKPVVKPLDIDDEDDE